MTAGRGVTTPLQLASDLRRAYEEYSGGRFAVALALADDAIERADPEEPAARPLLAKLRQLRGVIHAEHLGDRRRAVAEFAAALDAAPEDQEIRLCLVACHQHDSDWERVVDTVRPLLDAADEATARFAHEAAIQALLITPTPTTAAYRDLVAAWSMRFIEPRRSQIVPSPRPPSDRPLRIGFVHRFFASTLYHALIVPLLEELRRCGNHVAAISSAPSEDAVPPALEGGVDRWLNVSGLDGAAAARAVAGLELDVLVNLDGFSGATQFDLFARRPAPLLVSWHNTHYTFGRGLFDCILADETVLSATERQEYAEDIIDLAPCYFALVPPEEAPPVAPSPVLDSGAIVFGTMNRPDKIGPDAAASWSRILDAVPGSWLFLRNGAYDAPFEADLVRRRLHAAGIHPDRIVVAGRADLRQFLESYALIDIALDSFPFSGGFTTFQALWQGVPVVTFPGERWAARVSTSILSACRLPELVAADRRGYEALAIELARDVQRLAALRASIRSRVAASPMVDMAGFTRQFVAKLRERLAMRTAPSRVA